MSFNVRTLQRSLIALLLLAFMAPAGFAQTQLGKAGKGGSDDGDEKTDLEKVKASNPYKRMEWFFGQRGLLDETPPLPADEMYNLLIEEMGKSGLKPGDSDSKYETNTAIGGLNWSNVGPNGINPNGALPGSQWGVVSGRVRAMAIHPTDPNTVYIGAAGGGIWKTTDGGGSWSDVAASLASITYGALAIDPSNTNTIYAGGGEIMYSFNPWIYDGNGLFKSTDAGTSWTNITNGFGSQTHFGDIVVDPGNSNYVYAALGSGYWHLGNLSNEGIWRSTDAGNTWSRTLNVPDAFDIWTRSDSGYVYAAIGGATGTAGIYRSTDNGGTWTKINSGLPSTGSIGRIQVAHAASAPSTMLAIIYPSTKLYKSTDGGFGWSQVSIGVTIGGNYGSGWADQGWYDLCVAIHPTDPNIIMCGNVELYRGTNGSDVSVLRTGGSAWFSPCHVDYHVIQFAPSNPNTVYIGSDGGVFKSTDAGATWNSINNGISTIQFYEMASDPNNANTMIGGAQDNGNYRTTDGGATWTATTTGDGMYCAIDPGNNSIMYASTQNGNHYRSTNGGASFGGWVGTGGSWLSPLILHPNDGSTVFVTDYDVYKTTNAGSSFATLQANMTQQITSLDISPVNGGNLIAAGNTSFSNLGQVKVSTDSGATWTDVTANIPGTKWHITRVVFHPTQANTVFVVRSGFVNGEKLFMSTDMGATWSNITGNLPNVPHNDFVVDPALTTDMYVGNDFGVYHSSDAGTSWTREGNGMPFVPVMRLNLVNFGSSRVLRAATHGRGVYESPIDGPCTGPTVTTHPSNQTGCSGFLATFVSAATGTPTPSVQWEYSTNGGGTWNAWPGGTTTTISFTPTPGQSGYQFRAAYTSVCGTALTNVATLTVQTSPVVTGWPGASVSVCENTGTNLFAAASGNPAPAQQWQRSTDNGATWSDLTGETGNVLSLPSIPVSWDQYQYRSRFSNICGTTFTNVTTLTVLTNPVVTLHPANQSVAPATSVSFTATAASNPAPTVQWQVSTDNGATWNNVPGATNTTLTFTAQLTDNGNQYRARFSNVCTSTNSNAALLNVGSNPDIQITVVASTLTPQTGANMYFDVTATNIGNAASNQFTMRYFLNGDMTYVSAVHQSGDVPASHASNPTWEGKVYSSMVPGNSSTIRFTVNPDCDVAHLTNILNSFDILHSSTPDADATNDTTSENVEADNPAPLFTTFPADMNELTDANATTCDKVINSFGAYATADNCPGETVVITGAPGGNVFPVGTTVLTYTITDAGGRQTVQTQNINVSDGTDPVPDIANLPQLNAECSYTIGTPPTATDNCDGTLLATTSQALPWTISTQGTHTITWTYTDAKGNQATQDQTLIIDDVTAPVPDVASLAPVTGQCGATITVYPTATDNCVGAVTATTSDPLTYSTQGTFTVTWTYNDGNGNTSQQTQQVIIDDTTPPVPDLASLPNVTGQCSATITVTPTATDNCVGPVLGTTNDPLTYNTQGTFYVTWSYDDGNGNVSQQVQTVIVKDITPPVATCPPGTSVEADANDQAPVPNFMLGASATDNCTLPANITWSQSPTVNSYVGLGTQNITVTAYDEAGNPGNCTTTLTVVQRVVISPSSTAANVSFGCNSPLPFTRTITINNSGGNFGGGLLQWNATTGSSQITLNTASGFEGDALSFTVSPAGLVPGTYTLNIVITAWNSITNTPAKNSPYILPVNIIVEPPYGGTLTQTKPVTTSWTQFTNSYGHVFAEVKSNSGNIASFTATAHPCSYPRNYPRVNFVNRYFSFSTPGAVNVDIRTYFTDSETKPRVVNPQDLKLWQQPYVPGAWWNRGGTANPGANYVELTGVTNLAGNWLPAHTWVNWFPKPLALTVTGASYNDESRTAQLQWLSQISTDETGFTVERTLAENPGDGDWMEVGLVAFNEKGEYTFVDPVGQKGTYRYRISTWDSDGTYYASSVITIDAVSAPGGYDLAQNYPNPFNPETVISYTVPVNAHVNITVYDMFWQEVKVLTDAMQNAGTHKVTFNAADLPSGTYFYQMKTGSYIQTRKMNLTK